MARPLKALIDPSALRHNLEVARRAAPGARILAVVKANGYGHGLLPVARALAAADGFGVLGVHEAVRLREAGFSQPILLLEGLFSADELEQADHHRLALVVHTFEQIALLKQARLSAPIEIFLKINTGMNRLGFPPERLPDALTRLAESGNVAGITYMTHFASADEPPGPDGQFRLFRELLRQRPGPFTAANSAALLRYPETHGAWVRPGLMLYGASPFPDQSAARLGLRPAMTLVSEVIAVQRVPRGEGVGYGGAYVAEGEMRVGIVACGYADGYPRHAGTGTPVLVAGQRSRLLGRVSMDMLAVDLTGLPQAGIGSPVTLWGLDLPVEEVARAAGTISYELLTARAERVPVVEI